MQELLFRDEVFAIQGAVFEVSRHMGTGFLEAVYQECLARESVVIPRRKLNDLRSDFEPFRVFRSQTYFGAFLARMRCKVRRCMFRRRAVSETF